MQGSSGKRSIFDCVDAYSEAREVSTELILDGSVSMTPIVSILIPTFERPALLRDAVLSAVEQEAAVDYEIVVVDNGSSHECQSETRAFIASLERGNIRLFRNAKNIGMYGNWNRCVELARGKWITFLHDDDWLSPEFLRVMSPLLTEKAAIVACSVQAGEKGYDGKYLERTGSHERTTGLVLEDLILGNISPAPGILVLKERMIQAGGFDAAWYPCSDYVTYVGVAMLGGAMRVERAMAYYRLLENATLVGNTLERMVVEAVAVKRELLSRCPTMLGHLSYMLSVSWWARRASIRKWRDLPYAATPIDRVAVVVSRTVVLRAALWVLRGLARLLWGSRLPI